MNDGAEQAAAEQDSRLIEFLGDDAPSALVARSLSLETPPSTPSEATSHTPSPSALSQPAPSVSLSGHPTLHRPRQLTGMPTNRTLQLRHPLARSFGSHRQPQRGRGGATSEMGRHADGHVHLNTHVIRQSRSSTTAPPARVTGGHERVALVSLSTVATGNSASSYGFPSGQPFSASVSGLLGSPLITPGLPLLPGKTHPHPALLPTPSVTSAESASYAAVGTQARAAVQVGAVNARVPPDALLGSNYSSPVTSEVPQEVPVASARGGVGGATPPVAVAGKWIRSASSPHTGGRLQRMPSFPLAAPTTTPVPQLLQSPIGSIKDAIDAALLDDSGAATTADSASTTPKHYRGSDTSGASPTSPPTSQLPTSSLFALFGMLERVSRFEEFSNLLVEHSDILEPFISAVRKHVTEICQQKQQFEVLSAFQRATFVVRYPEASAKVGVELYSDPANSWPLHMLYLVCCFYVTAIQHGYRRLFQALQRTGGLLACGKGLFAALAVAMSPTPEDLALMTGHLFEASFYVGILLRQHREALEAGVRQATHTYFALLLVNIPIVTLRQLVAQVNMGRGVEASVSGRAGASSHSSAAKAASGHSNVSGNATAHSATSDSVTVADAVYVQPHSEIEVSRVISSRSAIVCGHPLDLQRLDIVLTRFADFNGVKIHKDYLPAVAPENSSYYNRADLFSLLDLWRSAKVQLNPQHLCLKVYSPVDGEIWDTKAFQNTSVFWRKIADAALCRNHDLTYSLQHIRDGDVLFDFSTLALSIGPLIAWTIKKITIFSAPSDRKESSVLPPPRRSQQDSSVRSTLHKMAVINSVVRDVHAGMGMTRTPPCAVELSTTFEELHFLFPLNKDPFAANASHSGSTGPLATRRSLVTSITSPSRVGRAGGVSVVSPGIGQVLMPHVDGFPGLSLAEYSSVDLIAPSISSYPVNFGPYASAVAVSGTNGIFPFGVSGNNSITGAAGSSLVRGKSLHQAWAGARRGSCGGPLRYSQLSAAAPAAQGGSLGIAPASQLEGSGHDHSNPHRHCFHHQSQEHHMSSDGGVHPPEVQGDGNEFSTSHSQLWQGMSAAEVSSESEEVLVGPSSRIREAQRADDRGGSGNTVSSRNTRSHDVAPDEEDATGIFASPLPLCQCVSTPNERHDLRFSSCPGSITATATGNNSTHIFDPPTILQRPSPPPLASPSSSSTPLPTTTTASVPAVTLTATIVDTSTPGATTMRQSPPSPVVTFENPYFGKDYVVHRNSHFAGIINVYQVSPLIRYYEMQFGCVLRDGAVRFSGMLGERSGMDFPPYLLLMCPTVFALLELWDGYEFVALWCENDERTY